MGAPEDEYGDYPAKLLVVLNDPSKDLKTKIVELELTLAGWDEEIKYIESVASPTDDFIPVRSKEFVHKIIEWHISRVEE